jgi:hypothetical protein
MKQYLDLDTKLENYLASDFTIPTTESDFENHPYLTKIDHGGKQVGSANNSNWWVFNFHKDQELKSKILSPALISLLNERDIDVGTMWIFYFTENTHIGKIHCDWGLNGEQRRQNNYAVNWTISPHKDHSMIWYEAISEGELLNNCVTSPVWHSKNNVIEIDRATISDLTLVRTNIPHNAENYGKGVRWAFSLKPSTIYSTWQDTLSVYKNKFNLK